MYRPTKHPEIFSNILIKKYKHAPPEHVKDEVKSVVPVGFNKGGPPADINLAKISHLSNIFCLETLGYIFIYEHINKPEQIDIKL